MARRPISHRRKLLFIAAGAVTLVVLGAVIGSVVLLSGAYSTAATKQHFHITYRILELGLRYSVRTAARDIEVPPLDDRQKVKFGATCYRQYCVECHGAPGIPREALGMGMLPAPSPLAQSAREWPAAHLYYVTKKGVRMAGMPAWEFRMSDEALWATVAFLKAYPFLQEDDYRTVLAVSHVESCPPATETEPYSRERAQMVLRQYACENCHQIDKMVGPVTYVGPILHDWHKRKLIAGRVPNTPENLVRWIMDPQAVSPHTLMPDLDVTEGHAREMARYLFEVGT